MITVRLNRAELEQGAAEGVRRRIERMLRGGRDANNMPPDHRWDNDIEGACGEVAYCKWRGIPWTGALGAGFSDAGRAEVRATRYHDGCLLLHPPPWDKPHAPYVLVTGLAPLFTIRGWCWGRDGMHDKFWRDPVGKRPAWFVPQSVLQPMVRHPQLI